VTEIFFFYFEQREMGASVRAVQVGVETHERTSGRIEHPTHNIFDQDNISSNKKREKDIKEVKN
jgi:hypothetical protein